MTNHSRTFILITTFREEKLALWKALQSGLSLLSMRRTLYSLAVLAVITLGACNKNDDLTQTLPAVGFLKFNNLSADQYDYYLDDVRLGSLYGGQAITVNNVSASDHRVKALQTANITGTPTLRQLIIFVKKDSTATFSFP